MDFSGKKNPFQNVVNFVYFCYQQLSFTFQSDISVSVVGQLNAAGARLGFMILNYCHKHIYSSMVFFCFCQVCVKILVLN